MTEEKNTNTDNVQNSRRELPGADELKKRFKAGSIPLQSDFADIIDMANAGYRATGLASDQKSPGKGMRISSSGQLEPNVGSYAFGTDKQGTSEVKVNTSNNSLVIDLNSGFEETTSGLSVKAGKGIQVSQEGGVSVDFSVVLPKGMIVMWSGDAAPDGWALCNGDNNTPDLRDRFIVMAGSTFKGKGEATTKTKATTVTGKVTVDSTTLKIDQIPSHTHTSALEAGRAIPGFSNSGLTSTFSDSVTTVTTTATGGGKGHNHTGSLTTDAHTHDFSAIPPYYALAFIIKL